MKTKGKITIFRKFATSSIFIASLFMVGCEPGVLEELEWFFGPEDDEDGYKKSQPLDSLSHVGSSEISTYPSDTLQIVF